MQLLQILPTGFQLFGQRLFLFGFRGHVRQAVPFPLHPVDLPGQPALLPGGGCFILRGLRQLGQYSAVSPAFFLQLPVAGQLVFQQRQGGLLCFGLRQSLFGGFGLGFFLRQGLLLPGYRLLQIGFSRFTFGPFLGLAQFFGERFLLFFDPFPGLVQLPFPLLLLPDQLIQKRQDLPGGQFAVSGSLCLRQQQVVLPAADAGKVLPDAVSQLIALLSGFRCLLLQPALQFFVPLGFEDPPEDLDAFFGIGLQKLPELPLGDHGNLRKLLPVDPQDLLYFFGHIPLPGHNAAIRQLQGGFGGLFHQTVAAPLGRALLLRASFYGVVPAGVVEGQLHPGGGLRLGIFGTQHIRGPAVAAGFAEKGIGDGIENGGFSGAGIPGDEVQPRRPQLIQLQLGSAGIRPKGGHRQSDRSHCSPSKSMPFPGKILWFLCGQMGLLHPENQPRKLRGFGGGKIAIRVKTVA